MRQLLDELAKLDYISFTNIVVDKQGKPAGYDVFEHAWRALFQRFDNTIGYGNFPGGHKSDKGMIISDNTDGKRLTSLVRKMAIYNPIPSMQGGPSRNIPMLRVIEDPHSKESSDSYFVQACDVAAYFLHQKYNACSYVRRKGAQSYFNRLQPVLNQRASYTNGFGIVLL